MAALGHRGHVLIPIPLQRGFRVVVAAAERAVGLGAEVGSDDRVEQQLPGQPRPTAVPGHQRGHCRQVAPGAVAAHHDAPRIDPQGVRIVVDPSHGRVEVVGGGGPRVLRGQPVVNRNHHGTNAIREVSAQAVVAVQIAEHEPAAVGVHHDRQRGGIGHRAVDPDRDVTARAGNRRVADGAHRLGVGRGYEPGPDRGAGLRAGHGVHRRETGVQRADQAGNLGVQAHAYCAAGRGRSGRACCSVGATRCGPSSMSRQIPIAVIRTGAASR